jgi:hypothetical protein
VQIPHHSRGSQFTALRIVTKSSEARNRCHTYEDGVALSYEMQQRRPHVTEQVSVAVTCIRKVPVPSIGQNTGKCEVFSGFSQPLQTNALMIMMMTMTNKFAIIWKDTVMA